MLAIHVQPSLTTYKLHSTYISVCRDLVLRMYQAFYIFSLPVNEQLL